MWKRAEYTKGLRENPATRPEPTERERVTDRKSWAASLKFQG